jgi:hypothetical protein
VRFGGSIRAVTTVGGALSNNVKCVTALGVDTRKVT